MNGGVAVTNNRNELSGSLIVKASTVAMRATFGSLSSWFAGYRKLKGRTMKRLLMTIAGVMMLAGAAQAQNQAGGSSPTAGERLRAAPNTSGAAVPDQIRPSGEGNGAPNRPRAYGETDTGRVVNPDRVPPLAPGGQGLNAESR
jgi:hypothetical protein